MGKITAALDFLFGCHPHDLSRVFTVRKRSYRVCCNCGAEFRYSLETMSIQRREPSRPTAGVRHLLTAR